MSFSVIPELVSGGIMLSYRCSNACRHCLYRCSPRHANNWMNEETMGLVFSQLANEPSLRGVHLAGGEATLNIPVLNNALSYAENYGVEVNYLETNCGWCESFEHGLKIFAQLKDHGLKGVLISASLFHNEFIPFCRTRDGIEAALNTFDGKVIIWTPEIFSRLSRLDHNRCHKLKESMDILKISNKDLWRMHSYLTPSGRAAETLTNGLPHYPINDFADDNCRQCLSQTGHFHIDPHGNLYTGNCPGISIANAATGLHPSTRKTDKFKAYQILQEHGPYGLLELCQDFKIDADGYIHKCHLCMEIRKELFRRGTHPEFTPAEYYL